MKTAATPHNSSSSTRQRWAVVLLVISHVMTTRLLKIKFRNLRSDCRRDDVGIVLRLKWLIRQKDHTQMLIVLVIIVVIFWGLTSLAVIVLLPSRRLGQLPKDRHYIYSSLDALLATPMISNYFVYLSKSPTFRKRMTELVCWHRKSESRSFVQITPTINHIS